MDDMKKELVKKGIPIIKIFASEVIKLSQDFTHIHNLIFDPLSV